MSYEKKEMFDSWIRRTAAGFFAAEFPSNIIVSVVKTESAPDLKKVNVFLSVFPEKDEKSVFEVIKKSEWAFRNYARRFLKKKFLPEFEFKLDRSARAQQKIEELLKLS